MTKKKGKRKKREKRETDRERETEERERDSRTAAADRKLSMCLSFVPVFQQLKKKMRQTNKEETESLTPTHICVQMFLVCSNYHSFTLFIH